MEAKPRSEAREVGKVLWTLRSGRGVTGVKRAGIRARGAGKKLGREDEFGSQGMNTKSGRKRPKYDVETKDWRGKGWRSQDLGP